MSSIVIRDAGESDIGAVQQIYAHYVLHGLATFEESPPTTADLLARRESILSAGLPFLVATVEQEIAGYAYATSYRPRPAYRYTVEDSVYVAGSHQARGIGRALLLELIARCERGDWRQMVAVIGDSGNAGSIRLHQQLGFQQVGTLKAVGFKLGRWVDTVLMQRTLGQGDRMPPQGPR